MGVLGCLRRVFVYLGFFFLLGVVLFVRQLSVIIKQKIPLLDSEAKIKSNIPFYSCFNWLKAMSFHVFYSAPTTVCRVEDYK